MVKHQQVKMYKSLIRRTRRIMNDKLNPTTLKAKYFSLKTEVQTKLSGLSAELVKDDLSKDILAKKDELFELLQKKYQATKTTITREATEMRSTVTHIFKTAINAKPDEVKEEATESAA